MVSVVDWFASYKEKKKKQMKLREIPLCLMCSCLFKWDLLNLPQNTMQFLGFRFEMRLRAKVQWVETSAVVSRRLITFGNSESYDFVFPSHNFANCFLNILPKVFFSFFQFQSLKFKFQSSLSISSCCFHLTGSAKHPTSTVTTHKLLNLQHDAEEISHQVAYYHPNHSTRI